MSGLCAHAPALAGTAGDARSPIHALDPRAKLVGLLGVTVVAVSAPLGAWPVWVACAVALAAVAALARVPAAEIWRRARVVLPLVLLVAAFVPFVRSGGTTYDLGPLRVSEAGLAVLAAVAAKAAIGTVSAVLLNATTPFPAVLHALEALRAPRLLVLIAAFTYRYLFVVIAEVLRLRAALAARAYHPRNALQSAAVGRAASSLFLRTHARAERVHLAMLARGFTGTMPRARTLRLQRGDALFLAALALLLPSRVLAEVLA
jgi:cobalt/nickel transport system permease protein